MITASHNLYEDNGMKIFGPDGYKLSDELENLIARHIMGEDLITHLGLDYYQELVDEL